MKLLSKNTYRLTALLVLLVASVLIIRQQRNTPYQHDTGIIFGTIYNITYQSDRNLKTEIEQELHKVDNSLSTFNKNSVISAVNQNRETSLDEMFVQVFNMAQQVSADTDGDFDITVAPLVNAWGFGFKNNIMPAPHAIDSIMQIVGYTKVSLQDGAVVKSDPRIMLDCSAIAKGYGADVVARCLRDRGIKNFMVEIGGEIVVSGVSEKRIPWAIGVQKPVEDSLAQNTELQTVINITDAAMATSGNYRNFYYRNGRRYAHTINPHTGRPVQHSILSATVVCKDCARADAYATAFMVMGLEKAKKILAKNKDLKAYIIYDDNGKYAVWQSDNL